MPLSPRKAQEHRSGERSTDRGRDMNFPSQRDPSRPLLEWGRGMDGYGMIQTSYPIRPEHRAPPCRPASCGVLGGEVAQDRPDHSDAGGRVGLPR
jgi:hypothetical protein